MGSEPPIERGFSRHPADIPVDIRSTGMPADSRRRVKDVSRGGLACRSAGPLEVGSAVLLTIPLVEPPFRAVGRVVWCRRDGQDYEVGIRFESPEDAYAARMVEQICQIEHYRRQVLRAEGRLLDGETAAREWITRYAAQFASAEEASRH